MIFELIQSQLHEKMLSLRYYVATTLFECYYQISSDVIQKKSEGTKNARRYLQQCKALCQEYDLNRDIEAIDAKLKELTEVEAE